jgi:Integral membrane protein EMC3/TMCO1-like
MCVDDEVEGVGRASYLSAVCSHLYPWLSICILLPPVLLLPTSSSPVRRVVKLPFPLTLKFRGTLQQGMELRTLDVRYVSSLSWYFLNSFGLRGILPFLLGEANCRSMLPSLWVVV